MDVAKKGRLKPNKRRVINENKAMVKIRKGNDEETDFDRFIAKCSPPIDACRHYSGVSRETRGLGYPLGSWQRIKGISTNIIKPKCLLVAF